MLLYKIPLVTHQKNKMVYIYKLNNTQLGKEKIKMLNYLLIQAGVAFLTFLFAVIGINVLNRCASIKGRTVGGIFVGLSIAAAVYYFLDVLSWNRHEYSMPGLKITLFIVVIVAFVALIWATWKDVEYDAKFKNHGIATLVVILVGIIAMCALIHSAESEEKYNMNIIEQSPSVQTYKYELIAASDGTNIEGNLNGESSGSFFLISGTMSSTVNGEIKQTDVYKFYYVANSKTGEIKLMTINADSTSIFYVEEGEEPYLLKKVTTPYSLDYNVDPPQECKVGESKVTYELHIPKGSIVGSFEFDAKN